MKVFGTLSIASFLKVILDIVWYVFLAFIVLMVIIYGAAIINPGAVHKEAYIKLPCEIEALDITFSDLLKALRESGREGFKEKFKEKIGYLIISHDPSNYYFIIRNTTTELRYGTHNPLYIGIHLVSSLIFTGVILLIIGNLRRILATLKQKAPFVRENARRLRIIGIAITLFVPLKWLLLWVHEVVVLKGVFSMLGKPLSVDIFSQSDLELIFLGLVILLISEVFRLGVKMKGDYTELQKDMELTV